MGEYRVVESKLSTSSTVIHAVPPPSAGKAHIVLRNHVSPTSLLHPIGVGNYTIPDTSAGCSSRVVPINHETVVALQGANVLHDRSYRPSSLNPFPPFLLMLGSRRTCIVLPRVIPVRDRVSLPLGQIHAFADPTLLPNTSRMKTHARHGTENEKKLASATWSITEP